MKSTKRHSSGPRRPARGGVRLVATAGVLALVATLLVASRGGPATAESAPDPSVRTMTASVDREVAMARSRLAVTSRQPHAGVPEAVTHPALDGLGPVHRSSRPVVVEAAAAPAIVPTTAPVTTTTTPPAVTTTTLPTTTTTTLPTTTTTTLPTTTTTAPSGVPGTLQGPSGILGVDVSSYQKDVDWTAVATDGAKFAYVKATEGTYYTDSDYFAEQYDGSYTAGLIRGAYQFAIPDNSSGAAQADYFVANGGGWSPDGHTLPGMLDIENNPYGASCYGLTQAQMVAWVASFDGEYRRLTGRYPVLYTNAYWWNDCTGGSSVASVDALAIANYGPSVSPMAGGWSSFTIWQYTDHNAIGVDGDAFNGTAAGLYELATAPPGATTPSSRPATSDLLADHQELLPGKTLISTNGEFVVTMKTDGNLVETVAGGRVLWKSATAGHAGAYAVMRANGNLGVFSPSGVMLWHSGAGQPGSRALLQDDGNFVVYTSSGRAIWQSGAEAEL